MLEVPRLRLTESILVCGTLPDHILRRSNEFNTAFRQFCPFSTVLTAPIAVEFTKIVIGSVVDQLTQITFPPAAAFNKLNKGIDIGTTLTTTYYACAAEVDHRDLML